VQNDRTKSDNKRDCVFKDNETGKCLLIDSATVGDGNSMKKEDEEILKALKQKYSVCGN